MLKIHLPYWPLLHPPYKINASMEPYIPITFSVVGSFPSSFQPSLKSKNSPDRCMKGWSIVWKRKCGPPKKIVSRFSAKRILELSRFQGLETHLNSRKSITRSPHRSIIGISTVAWHWIRKLYPSTVASNFLSSEALVGSTGSRTLTSTATSALCWQLIRFQRSLNQALSR